MSEKNNMKSSESNLKGETGLIGFPRKQPRTEGQGRESGSSEHDDPSRKRVRNDFTVHRDMEVCGKKKRHDVNSTNVVSDGAGEEWQPESQGETISTSNTSLLATVHAIVPVQVGEGDENENRSGKDEKQENERNGNTMESGRKVKQRESGETDFGKGDTCLAVRRQHLLGEEGNSQGAQRVTSLSAHTISSDASNARQQELYMAQQCKESHEREPEEIKRQLQEASQKEKSASSSPPQPTGLPVQESVPEWPCNHYKRKCSIKFPCCNDFHYCHRCHNDSDKCEKDDQKGLNGTHLRCLLCNMEQEITENSHHCINCNTQLADYFCGICKLFTGNEKSPFHCGPCGMCRIHSDQTFHCDICNVCMYERLRNNHKCRPNSGHDECCICLEDVFAGGGCKILPCSHKVHHKCAVAMLQNGVQRTCPVCRQPIIYPQE